jgi:hypothetical protein
VRNPLVRFSRAGDVFHYRWAARRCLRLLDLKSPLQCITIEGSHEDHQAGEYLIDVAEYSQSKEILTVDYFQLKHSAVRQRNRIGFAELKGTLIGFAERHKAASKTRSECGIDPRITFCFVTNRLVSNQVKDLVRKIAAGGKANSKLKSQLQKATRLRRIDLQHFCAALQFIDGEGDYVVQKEKLQTEATEYIAGFVHTDEVEKLITLVQQRTLPESPNGDIYREDVLSRLGVSSERDLFPAPPKFEQLANPIVREQHDEILRLLGASDKPLIIHAAGGVGKTVVARQLVDSLPKGSLGIVYDCFGGGTYRNVSQPRHRASDGLIQIANELATHGHCRTLIPLPNQTADALFRAFLNRLEQAVGSLRELTPEALLMICIDAADNAEMAAQDVGETSFVRSLIRESLPQGCRLVALCRTERVALLDLPTSVKTYELKPFSEAETILHLRRFWPAATTNDGVEFHRLTSGNPRAQASALAMNHQTIERLLESLGPFGTSVDEQISLQLTAAIAHIKDRSPSIARSQIDAICGGLANLPPFVPLVVLAQAARVDTSTVRSFVNDLGRPLWLTDDSVQFRDEPTETWFRNNFSGTPKQIDAYLEAISPLAKTHAYVARSLPQLLLRAGQHQQLIELALSDDFLPENSPIDERNIRVYRLQFAFRSALKLKRFADAARLALRAGEEIAGDSRQTALLQDNVDLIAPLQDAQRVQELAYGQSLHASWDGSGNIYSAALLSSVADLQGDARAYLRAARHWLRIYFEQREKTKRNDHFEPNELSDDDLAELAWAILNLSGPADCVRFVVGWRPAEVIFRITRLLVRRLVDAERYEEIEQVGSYGSKNVYLVLAVTNELGDVARYPSKRILSQSLSILANEKKRIELNQDSFDRTPLVPAIVSFAEASARQGMAAEKIRAVLEHYVAERAHPSLARDYYRETPNVFLRGTALRRVLDGDFSVEIRDLLPLKISDEHTSYAGNAGEDASLRQVLEGLFPWYVFRARLLHDLATPVDYGKLIESSQRACSGRYQRFDRLPQDVSRARFELLTAHRAASPKDLDAFATEVIGQSNDTFHLGQRLSALRTVTRQQHLTRLRLSLETSARRSIESDTQERPEQRAGWWVELARAVLPFNKAEATAYFDLAIEAVSKFGDEIVERWQAVISLADRVAGVEQVEPNLAYRFFRVAEIIGDNVAREKYWDRDEVFSVGARLAPSAAFAALSRWRDRDVGFLPRQLPSLISSALTNNVIPADVAWSFTGFFGCHGSSEFAVNCISRAKSKVLKQTIFDAVIRDCQLAGSQLYELTTDKLKRAKALKDCATEHGLNADALDLLLLELKKAVVPPEAHTGLTAQPKPPAGNANNSIKLLEDLDLTTSEGVAEAIRRFDELNVRKDFRDFWFEIVRRVPAGEEIRFLDVLLTAETADLFDVIYGVEAVLEAWSNQVAVKRNWLLFAKKLGKRFPLRFSSVERLHHWFPVRAFDEHSLISLREGAIEGLAESLELLPSGALFGFVTSVAHSLTTAEAREVLDFAISRFELHIAPDYADGPWATWLRPPDDTSDAVTGFIWSALASPDSAERWQATHCVRRLVELSCHNEIASLLRWIQNDRVGSFGSQRFPFYRLHAVLYLLIGIARAAIDSPQPLLPHAKIFSDLALTGMPHLLIQSTAATIALLLTKASPEIYTQEVLGNLQRVGLSPFPFREVDRLESEVVSLPFPKGTVPDIPLGWDFDEYWFKDLARLFDVDTGDTIDLAKVVITRDINVSETTDYQSDGRRELWNSGSYGHWATAHDHGSYPRVDTYSFYYSYHAFFSVAAQLLKTLQVVRRIGGYCEDHQDPWREWFKRHWLTRSDGRWLADRRDPTPLKRRDWLTERERKHWLWSVQAEDFFDCITSQTSLPDSLCVAGSWLDYDNYSVETIKVSSALVNREAAKSLATAIRNREHSYSCRLPCFKEADEELKRPPFELVGWIVDRDGGDTRLDAFDPHAREIRYPPLEIGNSFVTLLNLTADFEKFCWHQGTGCETLLRSETWSDEKSWRRGEREEAFRHGVRLCASIKLLKQLCATTGKDLIILVEISRREEHSRDSAYENLEPSHKVFIFSSNGVLKDGPASHQLG